MSTWFLDYYLYTIPFIIFCILATLQICFEWKRRRYFRKKRAALYELIFGDVFSCGISYRRAPSVEALSVVPNLQQLVREQGFERNWIDFEPDILRNENISRGACGVLHKGKIDNVTVVAKGVREKSSMVEFEMALAELQVLVTLGKHGHEHVVELIGACTEFWQCSNSYIFLEFCPLGDVQSFLASHREFYEQALALDFGHYPGHTPKTGWTFLQAKSTKPRLTIPATDTPISGQDLFIWSSQIATGMEFLEEKKIIHGDLAARNVLLKSLHHIKITDFGLARSEIPKQGPNVKVKSFLLPWRQMSLESLYHESRSLTTASEVWSFGVTCWEIFSLACIPYGNMDWSRQFIQRLEDGERLPRPRAASEQVYALLRKCWSKNLDERPRFEEIRVFFEEQIASQRVVDEI